MIELQLLALARLPTQSFLARYGWVSATRAIAAEQEPLFEFLSRLDNHWLLAEDFIEDVRSGAPPDRRAARQVTLGGPLGLRRRARTSVLASLAPRLLLGRAEVGRRTVVRVSWVLRRLGAGSTAVELTAVVEQVGLLDALVLVLGGRDWLERRFEATLGRLAALAATAAEEEDRPRPPCAIEELPTAVA